jgi:Ca2+-transporting ATPase
MNRTRKPGTPGARIVRPVHASVPGRTRFEVAGLYRSGRLCRQLEASLAGKGGIRRVSASTRTGRLLVVYSPETRLEDIVRLIETLLPGRRKAAPAPGPRRPATPMNQSILKAVNGFSSLLKGISPFPGPAFGATSGFQATGGESHESQDILPWHLLELDELFSTLGIEGGSGLAREEADTRLRRYGENSLEASKGRSDLSIFFGQFNSPPVFLLAGSAVIAIMTGGLVDAAVIMGVVMINSVIGFVTERQAEKTIASLSDTGVSTVRVMRDGQECEIAVENIVPGDTLLLSPGTYIAADARIIRSHRLTVDESALTGESLPVSRTTISSPATKPRSVTGPTWPTWAPTSAAATVAPWWSQRPGPRNWVRSRPW